MFIRINNPSAPFVVVPRQSLRARIVAVLEQSILSDADGRHNCLTGKTIGHLSFRNDKPGVEAVGGSTEGKICGVVVSLTERLQHPERRAKR